MNRYNNCNSICTQDSVIEVGKEYQFYESIPLMIVNVVLIEDNSTEDRVKLKLKCIRSYKNSVGVGHEFEVSMINEPIGFSGMWRLYELGEYAF